MSDDLCPFDSYPCNRRGYCFSRFFTKRRCSRWCRSRKGRIVPRLVKEVTT